MNKPTVQHTPDDVLDFWFPENGFWESREDFGGWIFQRMQGGMDEEICSRFGMLTTAAAKGLLDDWTETARGRLALLIALDQFPRSLWRDTPGAYAQDGKATRIAMEGIENGHFSAVAPWERLFYVIALGHCEGPDHLQRLDLIDRVSEDIIEDLPPALGFAADQLRKQNKRVRSVIERFGRHPHRNPIYGRVSSPQEAAYIEAADFPHVHEKPPV